MNDRALMTAPPSNSGGTDSIAQNDGPGWVQISLRIPPWLAEEIDRQVAERNESNARNLWGRIHRSDAIRRCLAIGVESMKAARAGKGAVSPEPTPPAVAPAAAPAARVAKRPAKSRR
jgi:hypothetical protein